MNDVKNEGRRAAWQRPVVTRLAAAKAENGAVGGADGLVLS